jgi:hypothetical protein
VQGIGIGIAGAIGTVAPARYVIAGAGLLGAVVVAALLRRVLVCAASRRDDEAA